MEKSNGQILWETIEYIDNHSVNGQHVNLPNSCWKHYDKEKQKELRKLLIEGKDLINISGAWEFRLAAGGMIAKREYFSDDGKYFNPELEKRDHQNSPKQTITIKGKNYFSHSFNAQNNSNINNSNTPPKTMSNATKWILATISTIIAGLIVWYITK